MAQHPTSYQGIDRPYDNLLQRGVSDVNRVSNIGSGSSTTGNTTGNSGVGGNSGGSTGGTSGATGGSPGSGGVQGGATSGGGSNGSVETMPVKSEGSMNNIWIDNFVRSRNWKPKSIGFNIDGQTGYAEFTNVYVSGEIDALSGVIGGFTIGATEISATDGTNTTIISSGANAFQAGPTGLPTVTITQDGILTATRANIIGSITAQSGVIGGFEILADYLKAGFDTTRIQLDTIQGIFLGSNDASIAPFHVALDGTLTATKANIVGTITAKDGTIGGWQINDTNLMSLNGKTGMSSFGTSVNDIRFWAGSASPAFAKFSVTEGGLLKSTSANIGGWIVDSTSIKDASGLFGLSSTVTVGDDIRFWAGSTTPASAPFFVKESGILYAISGTIGGWNLGATTFSGTGIVLDSSNQQIRIGSSTPNIIIDGIASEIRSSNYVSGAFGAGFHLDSNLLEVGNIDARGMIRTAVFQKDVISTVGGNLAVLDGDVLDVDMTVLDSCNIQIKGTTAFSAGHILRIKDGVDDEWMQVTDATAAPIYTVTRDKAATYASNLNPSWKKGATVVNYRASGAGGVYMTASEATSPYISIFDHAGAPWTTINTRMRMGNLNGYLGYTTDSYGIAIGDSNHYFKYDPVNGINMQGNISIGAGQYIKGGQTDFATGDGFFLGYSGAYKFSIGNSNNYITWDGTYMKIKGSFDVGDGGVVNNARYLVANLPYAPTSVGFNNPSGYEF